MNKLLDLRFVIGLFFAVIGALLLIYGISTGWEQAHKVNVLSGAGFVLFGIIMIALSYQKDKVYPD